MEEIRFLFGIHAKISPEEIFRLVRYYRLEKQEIPEELKNIYNSVVKKIKTSPSSNEIAFWKEISKIFPDAEYNKIVDGYELDIFLPSEKLIIEIDGVQHEREQRREKDMEKDSYFQKAYGYETLRVKSYKDNIWILMTYLIRVVLKRKTDTIVP